MARTVKQLAGHMNISALAYPRKLRSILSLFLRSNYSYALNLVQDTGALQDKDEAILGSLMKAILSTKAMLSPSRIRKLRAIFSIPSLGAVKTFMAASAARRYWQTGKKDGK